MRVISIANQKGGCGKTTTAINLAAALSLNGRRVLLIDLDPQANATLGLNVESTESVYNVISKLTPRRLNIEDIIVTIENSFNLVPSNILVGTLEQELADEIGRELKLTEAISKIKSVYDYILIDCPPSLGFLTVNALRASDEVIIPAETSKFSLQGVERLIDIVTLIKERLGHAVGYKVLVTMFDSRLRHSFTMLTKIKEQFKLVMLDTIIHVNVKLKESVVAGETVARYDKYSRGFKDYFSLAKELIAQEPSTQPTLDFTPLSTQMRDLIKAQAKEVTSLKPTTFFLNLPDAQSVYITGSFNDWSLDESYRMKKENGRWTITLPLKAGVHSYRYIIDGCRQKDPHNARWESSPFGDINSVIEVK